MGSVYLAEDTHLDRRVALKFLPTSLAEDPDYLARFRREAKILASLSHPGIVTIYSVEEDAGLIFLAMELVDGKPLGELIPENGMSEQRILALASSLADALCAAHDSGITHRDLKPGNLMVTAGDRVKILDFGLAKPVTQGSSEDIESQETEPLTQEGLIIGTVPYMAPEQLTGKAIDGRSDLFSFGAVLYEMTVGQRPFRGSSAADLVSSILRDQPRMLRRKRPDISPALAELIHQCLAKDPEARPESAREVWKRLVAMDEDCSAATTATLSYPAQRGNDCSIAVLPFADMSPDSTQDHLCDGIAEELIHVLNGVQGLRVVSRAMSFLCKGRALDIREIGERLDVDAVLEGAVRRDKGDLRITAQLVDVASGCDRWSRRFDRRDEDILKIEDEIAAEIAEALRLELAVGLGSARRRHATTSAQAYEYYLRGRKFFNQYRRRAVELARELFQRAIDADEDYALAHAGAAECCAYLYLNAERDETHLRDALYFGRRALELDPKLPEAHIAHSVALSYAGRPEEADAGFERAIRIAPRLFEARFAHARHLFTQGDLEGAVRRYEESQRLRTEDFQAPLLVAQLYQDLGRVDDAVNARRRGIAIAREHLELNPDDTRALYMGANGLVGLGELDSGREWARQARHLEPDEPMLLYNLACIYSMAGDVDEAIDCLATCLEEGFTYHDWIVHDSNLEALRGDPRYETLTRTRAVSQDTD